MAQAHSLRLLICHKQCFAASRHKRCNQQHQQQCKNFQKRGDACREAKTQLAQRRQTFRKSFAICAAYGISWQCAKAVFDIV